MTTFFDKLNLRPMERRLVIGVMVVVFIFLNIWFVWPQFKEWEKVKADFEKAKNTVVKYQLEIAQTKKYKAEQLKLEGDGSAGVLPEEMALQLRRTVQSQINQSGLNMNGMTDLPRQGKSESSFEEVSVQINYLGTGEQELVDFLYNVSSGRSMIRVKNLNVSPDAALQKLQGNITLTASYQKKAAPKIVLPTGATSRPAVTNTFSTKSPSAPPPKPTPLPQSANVER